MITTKYALLSILLCNVAQASQNQRNKSDQIAQDIDVIFNPKYSGKSESLPIVQELITMVNQQTSDTVNKPLLNYGILKYPLEKIIYYQFHFLDVHGNWTQFEQLIDHLLQLGANPDKYSQNKHLIEIAILQGDYKIFKKLLDRSTHIPRDTLLCILKHHPTQDIQQIIDTLIQRGFDINAQDTNGKTLLFDPINLTPEILWCFLDRGINTTIKDSHGRTYLEDYAILENSRHFFNCHYCSQPHLNKLTKTVQLHSLLSTSYHEEYKESPNRIILSSALLQHMQGNNTQLHQIITQSSPETLSEMKNMMQPGNFDRIIESITTPPVDCTIS